LSVADFGALAAAITFVAIIGTLGGLGLGSFWLRIFGVEGATAQRWITPSLKIAALSTTVALGLALVIPHFIFSSPLPGSLISLLLPVAIVQVVLDLLQSKFQLEEKYAKVSLIQLLPNLSKALAAGATFVLSFDAQSAAVFMSAFIAALAVVVLSLQGKLSLFGIKVPEHRHPNSAGNRTTPEVTDVVRATFPFALATVSYPIYFQGGLLSLGMIGSPHDAGLFGASFLVITAAYILPAVTFQKFLTARMQRWAHHDRARFVAVLKGSVVLLGTIGIVLSAIIHLNAGSIVSLIFGSRYSESAAILTLLAFAVPFRYYSVAIGSALLTGRSTLAKALCEVLAAAITASITILLYSHYGAIAAVIATILSEAYLAISYSLLLLAAFRKQSA
jgi:O-antigen/teichoic acid export membrane protein